MIKDKITNLQNKLFTAITVLLALITFIPISFAQSINNNSILFNSNSQKSLNSSFTTSENNILTNDSNTNPSNETNQKNLVQLRIIPSISDSNSSAILTYSLKPNKNTEDILTIHNESDYNSYTFNLYAVDAAQNKRGDIYYKLANQEQNAIGSWTNFNKKGLKIFPNQTLRIPYSIHIPQKITPGTYQGGFVVELQNSSNEDNQIKVVSRIITPFRVTIPGRKFIELDFKNFEYNKNPKEPLFNISLSNSGNVILKADIDLEIKGTLFKEPYKASSNENILLPDSSINKNISTQKLPFLGKYQASAIVNLYQFDTNKNEYIYYQTLQKDIEFTIIPYSFLICLLVLAIFIIFIAVKRQKCLKKIKENSFTHIVAKGETLTSIANLYKINWRTIVRLNKFKKPYTLRVGKKLTIFVKNKKK